MKIETLEEGVSIIDRVKDLTSKINRLEQDKGEPRELSILMHGARDQGIVILFNDPDAVDGCIVSTCTKLILQDLRAERIGLEVRFKEL